MITLIDFKAGNLTSAYLAFKSLGLNASITGDPEVVLKSSRIVFPGVGAAGKAMQNIREQKLIKVIKKKVADGTPFFGHMHRNANIFRLL